MILHTWFHSAHPHVQPRPKAMTAETALFRSKRGNLIATRLAAPSDSGLIAELLAGLSAQSLFLRYCMPMPRMAPEMVVREAARLGEANPTQRLTVIALESRDGMDRVVGVAEFVRDAAESAVAEIALVVADAYQRAGIGSALIAHLAAAARRHGVSALRATALAENTGVRRMVTRIGAPYSAEIRQGMLTVQIDLRSARLEAAPA